MGILIGILALIIIYAVYSKSNRKKKIDQRFANFSTINSFTPHESYVSADINSAIAFDKERHLIGLQDEFGKCYLYDERNIINSQIIVNEQSHQTYKFINIFGRYLVGKWIGGPEVAGIAALTSKVNIDTELNSIKLKIIVNDLKRPNYIITFLNGKTNKLKREKAFKQAGYWDGLLQVFIHNSKNRRPFE